MILRALHRSIPTRVTPESGASVLAGNILLLGLVLMMLLPAILLNRLGISYTWIGGEAWEKIHPATYVCVLALIVAAFSRTDPVAFLFGLARSEPRLMLFFAGIVAIMATTTVIEGVAELGFLLDTYFVPAVILMVLSVSPPHVQRRILNVVIALVIVNAIVGIAEAVLQVQFIPPTNADGSPFVDLQFRPWALLDHPLNNALVTSAALVITYPAIQGFGKRLGFVLLLLTALFAFGGRTAFFASVGALLALLMLGFAGNLLHRRFAHRQSIFVLVLILVAPVALATLLATTNIGARIAENLRWDSSAETRILAFNLLHMLSGSDLWFGVGAQRLADMSAAIGRHGIIIENFWLVLLARLGLLQFVLFVLVFLLFVSRLWQGAAGNVRLGVLLFLVVASSNNSLSVKTSALSLLTAMVICSRAVQIQPRRAVPMRYRVRPVPLGKRPIDAHR